MKDYFSGGEPLALSGSRDATREAFNKEMIEDGDGWMEMIKSCNRTSHTNSQDVAEQIVDLIITRYQPLLTAFEAFMQGLKDTQ